jgi:hypothetical protein
LPPAMPQYPQTVQFSYSPLPVTWVAWAIEFIG